MYRLLVVDDEAFITDGLARLLEGREEYELDVYRAYSALQALDFLNQTSVDIVITDIQMPGMTGLELLREIHSRWPACRVIFLTGYNDFEYAYQAVQYRAARYILKSEGDDAILAAVADTIDEIMRDEKNEELLVKAGEQIRLCQPMLRGEFLRRVLAGAVRDVGAIAQECLRLGVELDPALPALALAARLDLAAPGSDTLTAPVDIVVRGQLKHAARCEMALPYPERMLWLIQPLEGGSFERAAVTVKGVTENIQRTCLQSLGASLSFVFDRRPAGWQELPERAALLGDILNYRLDRQDSMAFADCEFFLGLGESQPSMAEADRERLQRLLERAPALSAALDHGNGEEFNALLSEFIDALAASGGSAGLIGVEIRQTLNLMFLSYINRRNLESRVAAEPGVRDLLDGAPGGFDAGHLKQYARLGRRLLDTWQSELKDRGDAFVENINSYIYGHLNADLSLVSLSDKVYLNPSYLSRRYKEITGRNISETIAEARLSRAKKLLSDGRQRIGDIAAKVGYESPAHFSRTFKRATGMTPQEYRDGIKS